MNHINIRAMFWPGEGKLYYSANGAALEATGKRVVTEDDLLNVKIKGIRTIKPNGEEIHVSIIV